MLIMGDDERGFDDADLILAKGFGEGEDEQKIGSEQADSMFKEMLMDSAKQIKTAFTSGDDNRILQALTQFFDAYTQSKNVKKRGR